MNLKKKIQTGSFKRKKKLQSRYILLMQKIVFKTIKLFIYLFIGLFEFFFKSFVNFSANAQVTQRIVFLK